MNWYLLVLKRYAEIEGRSRRKEFWMFNLINFIISMLIYVPAIYIAAAYDNQALIVIYWLYSLALLVPSFAVSVRRLHDAGKSGWNLLIGIIPLIGFIWLLVLFVSDSQEGSNEWGPNPKSNLDLSNETLDSHLV
jgi:uncharacterized membrane protein YhaH (DUF805 family)